MRGVILERPFEKPSIGASAIKQMIGSGKEFDGGIRIELEAAGSYDFAYGQIPCNVPGTTRDCL